MRHGKTFAFDQEGVTVTLPAITTTIKAVSLPIDIPASVQAVGEGFQPIRTLINIALVDEKNPRKYLTEFDPPFELRVRYTSEDLQAAQSMGGELGLAFWDGDQWQRLTHEKHKFTMQPDKDASGGGYGIALISRWGDPPIAWGI